MTDRQPEAHPDSPPRDSERGSVEQVDAPRDRDSQRSEDGSVNSPVATGTPDAGSGAPGGTDGVTRNQDADAQ